MKPDHFLDIESLSDDLWWHLVNASVEAHQAGRRTRSTLAAGRALGLLFFNPSLRTRMSMERAAQLIGADVTTLSMTEAWNIAWDRGEVMDGAEAEHVAELAGVLSQYYDAVGIRLFSPGTDYDADRRDLRLNQFAAASKVPVINLESAFRHPCQALADAAALTTHFEGLPTGRKFVLAWTYHPRALPMAVPNSTLLMAARMGMQVTVARPGGFELDSEIMDRAAALARQSGGYIKQTADLDGAIAGADVVYAKAWGGVARYTDPNWEEQMRTAHREWRITSERMERTRGGSFMHCLPARRNVVVDDAVLDGPDALHLLQAAMRLYAQKTILSHLWKLAPTTTPVAL